MIKKNQSHIDKLNVFTDAIAILLSFVLASWFWLDVVKDNSRNMASIRNLDMTLVLCTVAYAAWSVGILAVFGVYHVDRTLNRRRLYRTILLGNTAAIATLTTILYFFRLQDFSRGVLELYYAISTFFLIGKRFGMNLLLSSVRAKGYNLKHVLVIGQGVLAKEYTTNVDKEAQLGIRVDDVLNPDDHLLETLESRIRGAGIDEVVLALEMHSLEMTEKIVQVCERNGVKTSVIPFYNAIIPTRPRVENIGSVKLIRLRTTPLDEPANAFFKRFFDVAFSGTMLLLLSPLLLLIALGVKLSSPGPVIFRQERVGFNRKTFQMLKFRSMRLNSTENSAWSRKNDSRRTFFGAILRKTSLDELPQLWNVLKGEMSLVGPRPEIPHFVDQFRDTIPMYMVKHQVRPGITGWAQVNGFRGDTGIAERIQYDLWYIENWSIWLDLMIVFRTAFGGMINHETLGEKKK